jgi:hypothetical protein
MYLWTSGGIHGSYCVIWRPCQVLQSYWVCVTWINEYELPVEWHRHYRTYVFRERPAPIPLSNPTLICLGLKLGLRTEGLRVLHHIIRNSYVWRESCICYRTTGTVTKTVTCITSVGDERLQYCGFTEHIQYCVFTEHMFLLYHCQHSIELHFLRHCIYWTVSCSPTNTVRDPISQPYNTNPKIPMYVLSVPKSRYTL